MLVTMGNNNGPRETINEFPSGSAPNEIEINDVTSCTDTQYVTLVDGDGVQSVGVNNNLSFTEDTLCSPKISAGTIESEVIKSSIKTATETMPVSLASADSINYADEENLTYNPETRTLNSVNASFTNVDTNSLSVENMSFDGLCANTFCADVVNTCSIAPVSDFTGWVSCNDRNTVCAFTFGPKAYLYIDTAARVCEIYNAIRSLTSQSVSIAQGVSINQLSGSYIGGYGTAHFMKYRSGGQNSYFDFFQYSDWDNNNRCDLCPIFYVDARGDDTTLSTAMMIELWRR